MTITIREVRQMGDNGDYRGAERACRRALENSLDIEPEERAQFGEMLQLAIQIRLCKPADRNALEEAWLGQSVSFWRRVCEANPSDKEASDAGKFASARSHKLMTERHTQALRDDASAGFETPS